MTGHVLACGLCSRNPHAAANWVLVLLFFAGILILGWIGYEHQEKRRRAGLPPRQPTDISPALTSFLTAKTTQGYRHGGWAITPAGTRTTFPQCCQRGHLTPDLARAHAEQVARRIAATGR